MFLPTSQEKSLATLGQSHFARCSYQSCRCGGDTATRKTLLPLVLFASANGGENGTIVRQQHNTYRTSPPPPVQCFFSCPSGHSSHSLHLSAGISAIKPRLKIMPYAPLAQTAPLGCSLPRSITPFGGQTALSFCRTVRVHGITGGNKEHPSIAGVAKAFASRSLLRGLDSCKI